MGGIQKENILPSTKPPVKAPGTGIQMHNVLPAETPQEQIAPTYSDTANIDNIDVKKYEDYLPSGVYVNRGLDGARATNQAWTEQALNGLGRLSKIPATVAQNMASLADINALWNPDQDYTNNAIYNFLDEWKQGVDESMPIYQSKPDETFNFGDSGWWFENISGVTESAAAFVISSYLTGGALGKAFGAAARGLKGASGLLQGMNPAQAAKFAQILSPGSAQILQGVGAFTNTILANHMEGFGVALETSKAAKRIALSQGKSEEEANKIASESAATAYNINRANIALNLTSAGAFFKGAGTTRALAKKVTAMNTLKMMGIEGVQEGLEEEINFIAQRKGEAMAAGKKYGFSEGLDDMLSSEGLESAFWGAMGGIGQTGMSSVTRRKSISEQDKKYKEQQKTLEAYNNISIAKGNGDVRELLRTSVELGEVYDKLNEAQLDGDEEAITMYKDGIIDLMSFHAFEGGTTDALIGMYKDAPNNKDLSESEKKEYTEKSQDAVERIEKLEKEYIKSFGYINNRDVFINRANKDTFTKLHASAKDVHNQAKTKAYNKVTDLQAGRVIPKTVTIVNPEAVTTDSTIAAESTIDLDVVINPDTMEVMTENLPEDVLNKINHEIKSTPQYRDLLEARANEVRLQEQVTNINKNHERLTSPEVQIMLKAQQEEAQAQAVALEKEQKLTEKKNEEKKKVNAEVADVKRKQEDVKNIKPKGALAEELAAQEEQRDVPPPVSPEENIIEEPQTGEEGSPGVVDFKGLSAKRAKVEEDQFIETTEKANEGDDVEYSTTHNGTVTELETKAIDKVQAEPHTAVKAQSDGEVTYDTRTTYAPTALAYLAKDYDFVTTVDGQGRATMSRVDVSEDLLESYDLDLVTKAGVGTPVTVTAMDNESIVMTDPFNGEKSTWGVVKARLVEEGMDVSDHIPMGIFMKGKESPSAYLHDPAWINDSNVATTKESLDSQTRDLLKMRKYVLGQGTEGFKTTINSKGNGAILSTHDGREVSLTEGVPDKNIIFAAASAGELISNKPYDGALDDMDIINQEDIVNHDGIVTMLVPLQGGKANDEKGKFLAVPVKRRTLQDKHVDSVINAVRTWWKGNTKEGITADQAQTLNEAGLDLNNMYGSGSLSEYIKKITHGKTVDSKEDFAVNLSSSKTSSRKLAFDGENIYWAMGQTQQENIPFISPATPAEGRQGIEAQLDRLRTHLRESFANVRMEVDQNADFNLPLLNNDGTMSTQSGTYKDFIKENHTSTVMSKTDRNGDYIYTVQHYMTLDMEKAMDEKKEEELPPQEDKGVTTEQAKPKRKLPKKPTMKIGKKTVSLKPAQSEGSRLDAANKAAVDAFYDEYDGMETVDGRKFTELYPSAAELYNKFMSGPVDQSVNDFLEQEKCGLV